MTYGFFDTNLFIYQWEKNPTFFAPVKTLRSKMAGAGVGVVTSTMTLGEVMCGPMRQGDYALAQRYKSVLTQIATIVGFDERAAELYARVRADYRVRHPDAIQLACAARHGVGFFVTNDESLWQVRLEGIHFIVSIETAIQLFP